MKNKKTVYIICSLAILAIVFLLFLLLKGGTINVKKVNNITIISEEENLKVSISNSNDILEFANLLNKNPSNNSFSCPFGYVKFIIEEGYNTIVIYPATDGCHNFRIEGESKYFSINNNEWESLVNILGKYGVDRFLLESGKGI